MKTISLESYAPIISNSEIGAKILTDIKTGLRDEDIVIVDMTKIRSMATFCAKQIFGSLYIELGPEAFFNRIQIKEATSDVNYIIRVGVEEAIKDQN